MKRRSANGGGGRERNRDQQVPLDKNMLERQGCILEASEYSVDMQR